MNQSRTGLEFRQRIEGIHHPAHANDGQLAVGLAGDAADDGCRALSQRSATQATLQITILRRNSFALGEAPTYTLRLTNTGTVSDTYLVALSGNRWPTDVTLLELTLLPHVGAPLIVTMTLPATSTTGDTNTVRIAVVGHGVSTFNDLLTTVWAQSPLAATRQKRSMRETSQIDSSLSFGRRLHCEIWNRVPYYWARRLPH